MKPKSINGGGAYSFKSINITKVAGLAELLKKFSTKISVSYSTDSTLRNYQRTVRDISLYYGELPLDFELFLDSLYRKEWVVNSKQGFKVKRLST